MLARAELTCDSETYCGIKRRPDPLLILRL